VTKVKLDRLYQIRNELLDNCEKCGGEGYLKSEIPGIPNPCECMRVFDYVMELVDAGISQDYWHLYLDDLKMEPEYINFVKLIFKNLERFRENGLGVLFHGVNGIGKTSLMAEIGKEAIVRGYKVKYLSAQMYVDETMKQTTDKSAYMNELLTNDFILFDEIDKVYIKQGSNYVPKTLEMFLREAMVNANICIISATNMDIKSFTSTFGESTVSMLKRKMKFIAVDGEDYSAVLSGAWDMKLQKTYNYYHPNIVKQADRRQAIAVEQELEAWK